MTAGFAYPNTSVQPQHPIDPKDFPYYWGHRTFQHFVALPDGRYHYIGMYSLTHQDALYAMEAQKYILE